MIDSSGQNGCSLSIGQWHFNKDHQTLFTPYIEESTGRISYYFQDDDSVYQIRCGRTIIERIIGTKSEDATKTTITIKLRQRPDFFKSYQGLHFIRQVDDFTDNEEASKVLTHVWKGVPMQSLRKLLRALGDKYIFLSAENPFERHETAQETKDDEIFTDSGYSSLMPTKFFQDDTAPYLGGLEEGVVKSSTCLKQRVEDDARTEVSATPTVNPVSIKNSIAWVCDDIHGKITDSWSLACTPKFVERLGPIFKAFAINFGTESASPMSLQIMRFVYKHHE